MNLKNKTILVTGGSRGIGKAICLELAKKGSRIVVCYNNNKEMAELVAKECGHKSFALDLDVSDIESTNNAKNYLKEENVEIDVLINNAGVLVCGKHSKLNPEDIKKQTTVNVNGVFLVTHKFLKQLVLRKGTIVNIASVAPRYSSPRYIAYSATKAAVVNFTKGLANEYPEIKSYSISPGLTSTDMTEHEGVSVEKVSNVVIKVLVGEIELKSGEDVDVRAFY